MGDLIPYPKSARDLDLYLQEDAGIISEKQMKAEILRRDIKDLKREPVYLSIFLLLLSILGYQFGISVYMLGGFCVYPLLNNIYSVWKKVSEIETDVVYLEAGLELIRM